MGGGILFYNNYAPLSKIFKNLYIDISLPSQIDWLPSLIKRYDHKKFLFASDFPYVSHEKCIESIRNLKISKEIYHDLMYYNSKNLINSCK